MLTVRIPSIGEITFSLATMQVSNGMTLVQGRNEDHQPCTVQMRKVSWNDDLTYDYGWCHIVGYAVNGVHTSCDFRTSIS